MTTKVTGSVLADTAVTAGTYGGTQTLKAFTVDSQGRITYAANITSGVITAGTRGQGAEIIVPTIQYNALGQIIAATNTTIRTATTSVTGIVQLADSVSNTSTTAAATASAVKAAYDAAGANATTALTSAQANTGAGLISLNTTITSAYQANVGAGLINTTNAYQANVGAGLISTTSAYQANVGVASISAKNADNLSSGTVPSARISGTYTGITGVGTCTVGSVPYATSAGSATNASYASSAGAVPFNNLTGTPALLYLKQSQSQLHPINSAAGNVSDVMDITLSYSAGFPTVTIDFDYWLGYGAPTGGFWIVPQGIYRWKVWNGSSYVRVTIGNTYGIAPHIWTVKLWE